MKKEAIVLGFANQMGGNGKTTLTHLTALALGSNTIGKKILVIEADQQKSLFEISIKWKASHPNYEFPYDLISCSFDEVENKLQQENINEYDFIFIDFPSPLTKPSVHNILKRLDFLFIPTTLAIYDIERAMEFIDVVSGIKNEKHKLNLPFDYFTIINRANNLGSKTSLESLNILGESKFNLLESKISENTKYRDYLFLYTEIVGNEDKISIEFKDFIYEFQGKLEMMLN